MSKFPAFIWGLGISVQAKQAVGSKLASSIPHKSMLQFLLPGSFLEFLPCHPSVMGCDGSVSQTNLPLATFGPGQHRNLTVTNG